MIGFSLAKKFVTISREKNQMTVALLGLGIAYSLNFCCFSTPLVEEMSHE
jgi:hypothetical protein